MTCAEPASREWRGWVLRLMLQIRFSIISLARSQESRLCTSATSFSSSEGKRSNAGGLTLPALWTKLRVRGVAKSEVRHDTCSNGFRVTLLLALCDSPGATKTMPRSAHCCGPSFSCL
jgi:hypothetical protein